MDMTLHVLCAVAAINCAVLYAERSGKLINQKTQTLWAMVTRASMVVLLACIGFAYLNLAAGKADFEARHVLVGVALVGVWAGHIGMKLTNAPPTS